MRLVLMLFVLLFVTGCSTVSDKDKDFFYRGWASPKTGDDGDPMPAPLKSKSPLYPPGKDPLTGNPLP